MNLSVDWMTDAQNIASNSSPAMSALEIMGASIIFMMLCWQIPKLFAAVLGGSPALSGGDLVSTGAFVAGGAIALGSLGMNALGAAAGATGLLSSGAARVPAQQVHSGDWLFVRDARSAGSRAAGAEPFRRPTAPPSRSCQRVHRSHRHLSVSGARILTGMQRRISSQVPPDSGPHATPPRLNIDHNE